MRCFEPLIKRIFFDWRRFLCYLLTLAAIPPIKTFFLIIFVNIILCLTLFLLLPGISLIGFGILTFPSWMNSCGTNTLSSALSQELLPVCSVPSCSRLISRFPYSQIGLHSSRSIHFMPYSVALSLGIPLASVLFMTSLTAYGILIPTISPHISIRLKPRPKSQKLKAPRLLLWNLALAGDGTPVITSQRERKYRICDCASNGITDCKCDRYFSQPDCDIGWDSSRDCWYHGYDLYMLVASDSESDLPVFPLLSPASTHDSHGFLHCFFRMKCFLPDFNVTKLLLDSAHDAMPYYEYCRRAHITPFIDLNEKRGIKLTYKNDFTIGKDGVPVCREGRRMNHDGSEPSKHRIKYRCPLASRKYGCSCEHPCSGSKYGRTVHVAMKDNPRLFNLPPRDSDAWKLEYHARTSYTVNHEYCPIF